MLVMNVGVNNMTVRLIPLTQTEKGTLEHLVRTYVKGETPLDRYFLANSLTDIAKKLRGE